MLWKHFHIKLLYVGDATKANHNNLYRNSFFCVDYLDEMLLVLELKRGII